MNFSEYQKHATSFRLPSADPAYVAFGLVGELGEFYGHIAKSIRDATEPNKDHLVKELGDILWFVSQVAVDMGVDLQDVATANITKLSLRKANNTIQGSGDDR